MGDAQPDTMRAADADREAAAERLRGHHTAGRLSDDEFQQRLEQSMAARTFGELRVLEADLPGREPPRFPGRGTARRWRRGPVGLRLVPTFLLLALLWGTLTRRAAWHHGYPGAFGHAGPGFPWLLLLAAVAGFAVLRRRRRFLDRPAGWA